MDRNTRDALNALPSRGHKGLFRCINPKKYVGDASKIVYRSSWELTVMRRFDSDPDVLAWSSEPIIIPWADPMNENKVRRYIPDFMVKRRRPDGVVETIIVEVKPSKESPLHSTPKRGKGRKSEKRFIAEVMTHEHNKRKWESAMRYAAKHGMRFMVMTEKELFRRS